MYFIAEEENPLFLLAVADNEETAQEIAEKINNVETDKLGFDLEKAAVFTRRQMTLSVYEYCDESSEEFKNFDLITAGKIKLEWSLEKFLFEQRTILENNALQHAGSDDLIILFEIQGIAVHNPYLSSCGRFTASPLLEYGADYASAFNLFPLKQY
jgi:hypothetical protein